MIYLLVFFLIILLLLALYSSGKDLVSPSVVYILSFLFSALWAAAYADKWELNLHTNTFMVLLGGALEFLVICIAVMFTSMSIQKKKITYAPMMAVVEIQTWKLLVYLFVELITIFLSIRAITSVTGISNLSIAINTYRTRSSIWGDSVAISGFVANMRLLVNSGCYWFSYVFANNLLVRKKINILELAIIGLGMINGMVFGGRGGIANYLLAILIIYIVLYYKYNPSRKMKLDLKTVVKIIVIFGLGLFLFQMLGNLLGRNSRASLIDYLSVYCGAEIKNLDIFLQKSRPVGEFWGGQTFYNFVKWIGPMFGQNVEALKLDQPFQSINGRSLGNVATIYYSFIYDFGYKGVIFLVFFMALIVQLIYELVKYSKIGRTPNLPLVIYGYMFNTIVLAFFSNKFYENVFSSLFVKSLFVWVVFNILFVRVDLFWGKKGFRIIYHKMLMQES